jgi:ubiquinone/menaquinone biosynthesis C-methylase UbiE
LLYNQLAWAYNWIADAVSCGQWKTWVFQALPHLEGSRILELGPGPGHLQKGVQERGKQIFGIEASWRMLVRGRYFMENVPGRFNCVYGYAQSICFPTAYFDQVVATFPSEFIFDPRVISEIKRVLVPGGQLVVVLGASLSGTSLCHRILRWLYFSPSAAQPVVAPWLMTLQQAGFSVSQEAIHLPTSEVYLVLAKSPSPTGLI